MAFFKKHKSALIIIAAVIAVIFLIINLVWIIGMYLPMVCYRGYMNVLPQQMKIDPNTYGIVDGTDYYSLRMPSYLRYNAFVKAYSDMSVNKSNFVSLRIDFGFGGKRTATAEFHDAEIPAPTSITVYPQNNYMLTDSNLRDLTDEQRLIVTDDTLRMLEKYGENLENRFNLNEEHPVLVGIKLKFLFGKTGVLIALLIIFSEFAYLGFWLRFKKKSFTRFADITNGMMNGEKKLKKDGFVFSVKPPVFPLFNGYFSVTLPYDDSVLDRLETLKPKSENCEDESNYSEKPIEQPYRYSFEICCSPKDERHLRIRAVCPEIDHERVFYITRNFLCIPDSKSPVNMHDADNRIMNDNRKLFASYMSAAVKLWGSDLIY